MRVLLIEDDGDAAQACGRTLVAAGHVVETTDLGEDGIDLAKLYDFDVILLSLTLPDMSGFRVLQALRIAKVRTPVIVIGQLGTDDKVRALDAGADDAVSRPINLDELAARIRAVVRRAKGHTESIIRIDELALNLATKSASLRGEPVHLTGKEYRMLELLCLRKGKVVPKAAFFDHLYGGRDEPEFKIVDVFICKLRKKLETASRQLVETVWGRGYMIRDLGDADAPVPWQRSAAAA